MNNRYRTRARPRRYFPAELQEMEESYAETPLIETEKYYLIGEKTDMTPIKWPSARRRANNK